MHHHFVFPNMQVLIHIIGNKHIVGGFYKLPVDINIREGVDPLKAQKLLFVLNIHLCKIPNMNIFQLLGIQGVGAKIQVLQFSCLHQL